MKKYLLLGLVLGLASCNYVDGDRKETESPLQENPRLGELRALAIEKRAELNTLLDPNGFPVPATDCDLTLWVGEACYAGIDVNLDLVEYKAGYVGRRPLPACWTEKDGDQGSQSSTSNDMLAGYMLCRFKQRNLGAFERLAAYGEARRVYLPIPGWVMGDPYPAMASRVVMRPTGMSLVGRTLYALSGGKDDRSYRKWQPLYGPGSDSERHVQALSIFTDGLVMESLRKGSLDTTADEPQPTGTDLSLVDLTMQELEALKHYVTVEPENAFFQAVYSRYTGDDAKAVDLLLDPATPVPTYVRGKHKQAYELIHWLLAAQIVLERYED